MTEVMRSDLTPEHKQQLRALVRSEPFLLLVRTIVAPRLHQAQRYLQTVTNPRDTDMHMKGFIKACTDFLQTCAELANIPPERFYAEYSPVEEFLQLLHGAPAPTHGAPPATHEDPHTEPQGANNRNAFPA